MSVTWARSGFPWAGEKVRWKLFPGLVLLKPLKFCDCLVTVVTIPICRMSKTQRNKVTGPRSPREVVTIAEAGNGVDEGTD